MNIQYFPPSPAEAHLMNACYEPGALAIEPTLSTPSPLSSHPLAAGILDMISRDGSFGDVGLAGEGEGNEQPSAGELWS